VRSKATESDGIPIVGKARGRRGFLKMGGAGLAAVTFLGTASVACGQGVEGTRLTFPEGEDAHMTLANNLIRVYDADDDATAD
jgi:hypothetical protein